MALAQAGNNLECPDCGRYFHLEPGDTEKAGDTCPSDDCPSHEEAATCADCGEVVESVVGCPDGAEICRQCFDNGHH